MKNILFNALYVYFFFFSKRLLNMFIHNIIFKYNIEKDAFRSAIGDTRKYLSLCHGGKLIRSCHGLHAGVNVS